MTDSSIPIAITNCKEDIPDNSFTLAIGSCEEDIPCYYMMRGLAVWQPQQCHWVMKLYNCFGYVVAVCVLIGVLYSLNFNLDKVTWLDWINSITTLAVLPLPFFLLKYVHRYYGYTDLVSGIIEESTSKYIRYKKISKRYSVLALLLWLLGAATNVLIFLSFVNDTCKFYVMAVLIFYGTGWWACWLVLYVRICHIHFTEVVQFKQLLESFETSDSNVMSLQQLLSKFKLLKSKLEISQAKLSLVLSLPTALHLIDMLALTIYRFEGYYKNKNGLLKFQLSMFILGIAVDFLSVFLKLIPAALVSFALHKVVKASANLCLLPTTGFIDQSYFNFHQYLFMCEDDLGYKILGVKISLRLMLTLLVTFVSLLSTVLKITL